MGMSPSLGYVKKGAMTAAITPLLIYLVTFGFGIKR